MPEVYVVVGASGEYSDHTEWMVAAYEQRQDAQQHADVAGAWARTLYDRVMSDDNFDPAGQNPHDPDMQWRGFAEPPTYHVDEVELRDSPPARL